jgi:hypothetical protein
MPDPARPVALSLRAMLPGVVVWVRTVLLALSQHLLPVALGDVAEVCAAATPIPANMAAAMTIAVLVIWALSLVPVGRSRAPRPAPETATARAGSICAQLPDRPGS